MSSLEETSRTGEDTDHVLFTGLNENVFRLDSLPLEADHCELLLDAMDGRLGQLQVWSHSPTKGTGLGNTTQTNDAPTFQLDLMEKTSEDAACCLESSVSHRETIKILDRSTSDDEEEEESRREQVIWRLEKLLGDAWKEGAVSETRPPPESICTEDFVRRFREEMVDLSPTGDMEQLNKEDSDLSDKNQPSGERKESLTTDPVMDPWSWSWSNKHQMKCNFGNCGVNMEPVHEEEDFHKGVSVRSLDSVSVSDSDSTRKENAPQSASVGDQSNGPLRDFPAHKTHSIRRKTCRLVCSLRDNKDINEECDHSGGDPVRTSEMQSDWNKMKEQLLNLQKKCEKEEKKLKLKWSQLKDAESCLSELQQKKKHALQHLEQLSADTAQMEQEKRTLESVLRDMRTEKRFQLQQLQRQRDARLLQVQKDEEHLAALSRHKQTLQDGSCMNTSKARMSALQCEEMERRLDQTKTELFTEQRRAREKIQLLQEKLEETCAELLRVTEAEHSLRNRCAALEKQIHRREQTEQREETALRLQQDVEQQLRSWGQQLTAECQQLHLLVERDGAQQGAEELHHSFTLAEALPHLRAKREQLKLFIGHLKQKLESQKHTNEQLKKEKEQELSIQRQQLRAENDRALTYLRTRLIQDHIEELSSVKCAHESEAGGVAASLHRQLQDKDRELIQLQRSMAQWKQLTAARLAAKFAEQITAELERCKAKLIRSRKALKIEEVRPERETHGAKKAVCSHWLDAADSAAAHVPSDVASLKLLHHLQSKVKQLRGENHTFMWAPNPPHTPARNVSGTFLTQISQGADGAEAQTSLVSRKGGEPSLSVNTFTPVI